MEILGRLNFVECINRMISKEMSSADLQTFLIFHRTAGAEMAIKWIIFPAFAPQIIILIIYNASLYSGLVGGFVTSLADGPADNELIDFVNQY